MNHNLNDLVQSVYPQSERLMELLDVLKDEIADVRRGEYSLEARKCAITLIDELLYNKIKSGFLNKREGE